MDVEALPAFDQSLEAETQAVVQRCGHKDHLEVRKTISAGSPRE